MDLLKRIQRHGNQLTLSDVALVSVMIYLDLRQPERNWRGQYLNIKTWYEYIYWRESVQSSLVEYVYIRHIIKLININTMLIICIVFYMFIERNSL